MTTPTQLTPLHESQSHYRISVNQKGGYTLRWIKMDEQGKELSRRDDLPTHELTCLDEGMNRYYFYYKPKAVYYSVDFFL